MDNDETVDEQSVGATILPFSPRETPTQEQAHIRLRQFLDTTLEWVNTRHAYIEACERIGWDIKAALNDAERPFTLAPLAKRLGHTPVES
jgi:hypothetical protein